MMNIREAIKAALERYRIAPMSTCYDVAPDEFVNEVLGNLDDLSPRTIEQIHMITFDPSKREVFAVFVPERLMETLLHDGIVKQVRRVISEAAGFNVPVVVFPDTWRIGTVEKGDQEGPS